MTAQRPTYLHPLLDAKAKGVVISRSSAPRLALSAGRADFLLSAQRQQRRPVLVTTADAVLSDSLLRVLREAGGAWGVSDGDSAWDGLTGRRLRIPEAAQRRPALGPEDLHPSFFDPDAARQAYRVRFSTARRHRNALETILGGDVESLAQAVAGAPPVGWGMHEPSGMRWDRETLTTHAREAGTATRYLVAGPRAADEFHGSIAVHRTRYGIEELSELLVAVGDEGAASLPARLDGVADALAALAPGIPLFATAFADPGRADLFVGARMPRPSWPLALLIGAPGVRALDVDVDALAARHGGRVLGARRVPSLLIDLTAQDPVTAWASLRGFADDLGVERVSAASPVLSGLLFGGAR
jgi:hypothetical protein